MDHKVEERLHDLTAEENDGQHVKKGDDDPNKTLQVSGGKSRVQTRRFLLFYAGNDKGYYQDTKHFTEAISRELCRRGHKSFICDLLRGSHGTADLEAYEAAGVDAVLTFNQDRI